VLLNILLKTFEDLHYVQDSYNSKLKKFDLKNNCLHKNTNFIKIIFETLFTIYIFFYISLKKRKQQFAGQVNHESFLLNYLSILWNWPALSFEFNLLFSKFNASVSIYNIKIFLFFILFTGKSWTQYKTLCKQLGGVRVNVAAVLSCQRVMLFLVSLNHVEFTTVGHVRSNLRIKKPKLHLRVCLVKIWTKQWAVSFKISKK
jgi:hypothetical protein